MKKWSGKFLGVAAKSKSDRIKYFYRKIEKCCEINTNVVYLLQH